MVMTPSEKRAGAGAKHGNPFKTLLEKKQENDAGALNGVRDEFFHYSETLLKIRKSETLLKIQKQVFEPDFIELKQTLDEPRKAAESPSFAELVQSALAELSEENTQNPSGSDESPD